MSHTSTYSYLIPPVRSKSTPSRYKHKKTKATPREIEPPIGGPVNDLVKFDTKIIPLLPPYLQLHVAFYESLPDTDIGSRLPNKTGSLKKRIENYIIGLICKNMTYVHCEVCFDFTIECPRNGTLNPFIPDKTIKNYDKVTATYPVGDDKNKKYVAYGVMSTDGRGNKGRVFCKRRLFNKENYVYIHYSLPKESVLKAIEIGELSVGKEYDSRGMKGCATIPSGFDFDKFYCGSLVGTILAVSGLLQGVNICSLTPDDIYSQLMEHSDKGSIVVNASHFEMQGIGLT